jgi:hypothetical protein
MAHLRKHLVKLLRYAVITAIWTSLAIGAYYGYIGMQRQMTEASYIKNVTVANNYFQAGNYSGCIDVAKLTLATHPNDSQMQSLITNAQTKINQLKKFDDLLNNARTALQNGDYTNAISWANTALQIIPSNTRATAVKEDALKQLELYHDAVVAANNAWQKGDPATAAGEADQALAVYPDDQAMLALQSRAQTKITNAKNYTNDLARAGAALQDHDYTNAVAWAAAALLRIPGSTEAAALQAKAKMQLDLYKTAVAAANTAWQNRNFLTVVTAANRALGICPSDQTVRALRSRAQTEIANREAYDAAMASAHISLQNRDYTNTLGWVNIALQKIPGSTEAGSLQKDAQEHLTLYHTAVAAANAAREKGDSAKAAARANEALAIYPDNQDMLALHSRAMAQTSTQAAYAEAVAHGETALEQQDYQTAVENAQAALKAIAHDERAKQILDQAQKLLAELNANVAKLQAEIPTSLRQQDQFNQQLLNQNPDPKGMVDFSPMLEEINKAQQLKRDEPNITKYREDILHSLDACLLVFLESFNVSEPDALLGARIRKASILGAIDESGKPYFQTQVNRLERAYQTGHWLEENRRQACLTELRSHIDKW